MTVSSPSAGRVLLGLDLGAQGRLLTLESVLMSASGNGMAEPRCSARGLSFTGRVKDSR